MLAARVLSHFLEKCLIFFDNHWMRATVRLRNFLSERKFAHPANPILEIATSLGRLLATHRAGAVGTLTAFIENAA